jgi:biotin carboxylase
MSTLAVVFGTSAVTVGQMLMGLDFCEELIFVLPGDERTAQYAPVLASAGSVLTLTGDPAGDADRLAGLRPDGITTYSEDMLAVTARLAAAVGLPFHSVETVERLTDKDAQRRAMREHGIETPASWLLRDVKDWPADVVLPAVLKPATGVGSRNTYLVHDSREGFELVQRLLADEERLVLEECLIGALCGPFGDYISVENACVGDDIRTIGVTGKFPLLPRFKEAGHFVPARLEDSARAEVVDLATRTLRALGVRHGITQTEIKLTPLGPRVIEVNGRLGGFMTDIYSRAAGLDLAEMAGRLALGLDIVDPVPPAHTVVFQHSSRPPIEATRLLAVDGARTLVRTPGVVGRMEMVKPGSVLPADGSQSFLDSTIGQAQSHEDMFAILDDCLSKITYTFETAVGPVALSGNELRPPHQQSTGPNGPVPVRQVAQ